MNNDALFIAHHNILRKRKYLNEIQYEHLYRSLMYLKVTDQLDVWQYNELQEMADVLLVRFAMKNYHPTEER